MTPIFDSFNENRFGGETTRFVEGGGNDTIDGGLGNDKVIFTGLSTEYTVTAISDGYLIVDSVAGRDGSTTVRNIETAQFPNVSAALGGAPAPAEPQVIPVPATEKTDAGHDPLVLPGLVAGKNSREVPLPSCWPVVSDDAFLLAGVEDVEGPLVLPADLTHAVPGPLHVAGPLDRAAELILLPDDPTSPADPSDHGRHEHWDDWG